jgi:hypothetical protein
MPIRSGTFSSSKPLVASRSHRAYADVQVVGPTGGKSPVLQCLVDTGADFTILPMSAATVARIAPAGPPVTFRTAGGARYTLPSHPVELIVEGYLINAVVAFSLGAAFNPIVGRLELVSAFDIGSNKTHWFWD